MTITSPPPSTPAADTCPPWCQNGHFAMFADNENHHFCSEEVEVEVRVNDAANPQPATILIGLNQEGASGEPRGVLATNNVPGQSWEIELPLPALTHLGALALDFSHKARPVQDLHDNAIRLDPDRQQALTEYARQLVREQNEQQAQA